jgi:hypothetical protein
MQQNSRNRLPSLHTSYSRRSENKYQSLEAKSRTKSHRGQNFNKYYINPELRYRKQVENPKESDCRDETYIYNNLHNYNFWNWTHPLDQYRLCPPSTNSKKINLQVL